MKIALIGYGKMGHMIEDVARKRGHEIVAIIDKENNHEIESDAFRSADVAIEFTSPSTASDNCRRALHAGVKVVSGSTGWSDFLPSVREICETNPEIAFLWSSNFSIGVNIFFAVNRYAARLLSHFSAYHPSMKEIHHIHKLDHPSGTAITLAETIIANAPEFRSWSENPTEDPSTIIIAHERTGEVPGTHIVEWDSDVDTLTFEHRAKNRGGFATGAVMAAEWLAGTTGFKSIDDFMDNILTNHN